MILTAADKYFLRSIKAIDRWHMLLFLFGLEGKLIHSMVAHLDSVTCLAVDPNGLYLMSGSEYSDDDTQVNAVKKINDRHQLTIDAL